MATKKTRVNFAQIRDNRLKQQQDADAPPPLPKEATELYMDGTPPDIPVSQPAAREKEGFPSAAAPEPETIQSRPIPAKLDTLTVGNEGDMPNRVEARVSDAELAVIKQVVRKEKGRRSKASGEPSGFNRQDLVREGLLAICRRMEPDFDAKVKKMTAALKEVE